MAASDYSPSSVYLENATGKYRVKGSVNIVYADETSAAATFANVATQFNLANSLLALAGINPSTAEVTALALTAPPFNINIYHEPSTGKIRVKGAANNPATATAGSATFNTLEVSINAMLDQLTNVGINPAVGENLAEQDKSYSTTVVYNEQNTGKIRVKGAVRVVSLESADVAADAVAERLNDILDLLTSVGINPAV